MVYVETQMQEAPLSVSRGRETWTEGLCQGRPEEEAAVIRQASELAGGAHDDQVRASGEPYLIHVFSVAEILARLNLDHETVAAAILHDVVEDTPVTLEDVAEACGEGVAHLVDGVTKMRAIGKYQDAGRKRGGREQIRAESLRKLLLAMAEDVRVVLIKLADRLHNMRTLDHLSDSKRKRIARETLDIYAPLANRLGIWQAKWELEDLAFRHLEPEVYKEIASHLDERRVDRQRYLDQTVARLQTELEKVGVRAEVKGRPKHIYSIWKKMRGKGVGFHELFDVRAVRILVDSVADCYHALGVVHTLWRHIPKEFDDYIATPKENNYQSIHTAVVGPEGKVLEVQIRTHEMDRHAELGVAAHWRYKEGGKGDRHFEQKVAWLRQLLDWKEEEANAGDFIDRFKSEVFQDRVYVLTPQGEVMDLPQGATPLDFAYHIHTEVGHRCRGAKVDGRMVPLTYELKSGEQVEVLTARQGVPSRDWLNRELGYLKTNRAHAKARHWFKQQDQQRNISEGRAALDRELRRLGVERLEPEAVARELGYKTLDELVVALGRGDASTTQVARVVQRLDRPEQTGEGELPLKVVERREPAADDAVRIQGVGNLLTNLARCCKPAPGDPIRGFITQGRGVTIHRSDCRNVLNVPEHKRARLIEVEWGNAGRTFPVDVEVRAFDRQGLLRDISAVLANEKVNVISLDTRTNPKDHSARFQFTMEVGNTSQLSRVLSRINQLPNVMEARRRQ